MAKLHHLLAILGALAAVPAAWAQTPADLTGHWVRKPAATQPAPSMTAWARGQAGAQAQLRRDIERWCQVYGMPVQMERPEPLVILQDRTEVLIMAERLAKPRHIYTAVTQHPDPAEFDFTGVGHSIGHWEGDSLVVESVGFTEGLGPAGAPRTEESRLVERFRLSAPNELSVQSTWTDAKALTRPYSWTTTYARAPAGATAREYYCDPRETTVSTAARPR